MSTSGSSCSDSAILFSDIFQNKSPRKCSLYQLQITLIHNILVAISSYRILLRKEMWNEETWQTFELFQKCAKFATMICSRVHARPQKVVRVSIILLCFFGKYIFLIMWLLSSNIFRSCMHCCFEASMKDLWHFLVETWLFLTCPTSILDAHLTCLSSYWSIFAWPEAI